MAAAFQRISGGRLLLNVVTGGEPTEQKRFGDHLDQGRALRPHRRVPLGACAAPWTQAPFDFDGEHYQVEGAEVRGSIDPVPGHLLRRLLRRRPGRSPPSTPTSTSPGASRPEQVAEKIDWIRGLAAEQGRDAPLRAADPHALARHQRARPGSRPQWLLDGLDPATDRQGAGRRWRASESVGPAADARRCTAAARRSRRRTTSRSRPNLWSGVGPGARRGRHGAGRQPPGGRRPARGVPPRSASTSSSCPATRTSRRRTGSPRA